MFLNFGSFPLSLSLSLARSTIWSTSIGLAFFNLLPLPHLDGALILAALLETLRGSGFYPRPSFHSGTVSLAEMVIKG